MSKLPKPSRTFRAITKALEEEQRKQRSTSPFFGTGLHPNGQGGLDSDNFDATHGYSFKGDGSTEWNGPMDVGGPLNVDGPLTVTGPTVIGGTLSLPAGIIDNDALSQPVVPKVVHGQGDSFGVTNGSGDPVATATVAVPAGFTTALVTAVAAVTAFNTTAAHDALYAGAIINGGGLGWLTPTDVEPSRLCTVTNGASALLTGLGSSFTVQALAATNAANWAAYGGNVANIDATVLFLR